LSSDLASLNQTPASPKAIGEGISNQTFVENYINMASVQQLTEIARLKTQQSADAKVSSEMINANLGRI